MLELSGHINEHGQLKLVDRNSLVEFLDKNKKRNIKLRIELKRKKRSNQQNRYYWGVVIPLVSKALNDYGNEFTHEETHEFLKVHCNSQEIEIKDGLNIQAPGSTSNMTTVQFMEYLERVNRFASEILGLYIPSPNEQTQLNF